MENDDDDRQADDGTANTDDDTSEDEKKSQVNSRYVVFCLDIYMRGTAKDMSKLEQLWNKWCILIINM